MVRDGIDQESITTGAPPSEPRANEQREPARRSSARRRRRTKWLLAALLLAIAVGYFVWHSLHAGRESTDDAQIDAHITPVSAKVSGPVVAVHVDDNQQVKQGDLLVQVDPRDFEVALRRAKADLAAAQAAARAAQSGVPITATTTTTRVRSAEAGLQSAQANADAARKEVDVARSRVEAALAGVRQAQANYNRASRDLARMTQLVTEDDISRQQYDATVAAEAAARATLDNSIAALKQAQEGVAVAQTHVGQAEAGITEAQAALESAQTAPQQVEVSRAQAGEAAGRIQQAQAVVAQAELNLQYTKVQAPANGMVTNKAVEVGQVIQMGQPLLATIPLDQVWVTANFKETQLKNMRPGNPARVSVDAYGGTEYRGKVDSIAAATGARLSVLPPENASGNYVKVVQRVPVKIVLESGQDPNHLLRPGMSVTATVMTR